MLELPQMEYDLATVVSNEDLGRAGCRIRTQIKARASRLPNPGQFAMLRPEAGIEAMYLSRPISYLDAQIVDSETLELSFYIKVYGPGSAALVNCRPGDRLIHLGPLGSGFPMDQENVWLVGGGVGIAPFYHLAHEIRRTANSSVAIQLFYGGRSATDLPFLDDLNAVVDHIHTSTEDGTHGSDGLVTEPLKDQLKVHGSNGREFQIYTCGPTPMMKAVALLAQSHNRECLVSLETRMACGYGVCLGCAIHHKDLGYIRGCVEGPVLNASKLDFSERWL